MNRFQTLLSISTCATTPRRVRRTATRRRSLREAKAQHNSRSREVQVDPIKPVLKLPETMPLKLRYDESLSNFAFRLNLRRYSEGRRRRWGGRRRGRRRRGLPAAVPTVAAAVVAAGAARRSYQLGAALQVDPINPKLKATGTKRVETET